MLQKMKKEWDVLALLICADLLFLLLHIIHYTTPFAASRLFAVQQDGGFAEFFQYIKELWFCIICLILFFRRRELIYSVWALLAGYFLLDDALRLHETLGMKLVFHLDLNSLLALRAQDWGELMVMAAFGGMFLVAFLPAFRASRHPGRQFTRLLWPYIALFLFFCVVMDMVDIWLPGWGMTLIEDGGEMISMSLILWQAWRLYQPYRASA